MIIIIYYFMELDFYEDNKCIIFNRLFKGPLCEEHIKKLENLKVYDRIKFGHEFNNSIDLLPNNIRVIVLGDLFDKPIDNLHNGLEKIHLGEYFNKNLNNLPTTLKNIHIGLYYNKPVDFLPNGLEKITFSEGTRFSKSLDNLPNSLIYLEIPILFQNDINNLPESIEFLLLGVKFNKKKYNYFDNYEKKNKKKVNYLKNQIIDVNNNKFNNCYYYIEGYDEIFENRLFNKKINKYPNSLKRLFVFSDYKYVTDLKRELEDKLIIIYNQKDFF